MLQAFDGIRRELSERMDVSTSGLLAVLRDKRVITEEQSQIVDVGA